MVQSAKEKTGDSALRDFRAWERRMRKSSAEESGGRLTLLNAEDVEKLSAEGEKGVHELTITQSVMERSILRRVFAKKSVMIPEVSILHLIPEEDTVSLYFFPNLFKSFPRLHEIVLEGRCTLKVDCSEKNDTSRLLVSGKEIAQVKPFYPGAKGVYPFLYLPGTDPASVPRACRVRLMIPFFRHPEWYQEEEWLVYSRWLHRHARPFFMQAIRENAGGTVKMYLEGAEQSFPMMRSTVCVLMEAAADAGDAKLAAFLEEYLKSRFSED
ncbi:MAG: hypothetical protein IJI38_02015 [Clostridia bacterium]|nr:hypothetical protein [Clostridia bacterium]